MSCVTKSIMIDGVEFQPVQNTSGRSIFVLDRGFVYTGYESGKDGDSILVSKARCIRIWGTTGGLAQLANEGPQSGTKLDGEISLRIPSRAIIHIIPCKDNEKWNK